MQFKFSNLSYEERLSRLEEAFDKLLNEVRRELRKLMTSSQSNIDSNLQRRGCDNALLILDEIYEKRLLIKSLFGAYGSNPMFHAIDEDKLTRKGSFGFTDTGDFVIVLADNQGEYLSLKLSKDDMRVHPQALKPIASYTSVVADLNTGQIGIPSSDKNKKTDIKQLSNCLEKVLKIKPVSFKWRTTGEKAIGFINEDLKKYAGVSIHELISLMALLWGALQELYEIVINKGCEPSSHPEK